MTVVQCLKRQGAASIVGNLHFFVYGTVCINGQLALAPDIAPGVKDRSTVYSDVGTIFHLNRAILAANSAAIIISAGNCVVDGIDTNRAAQCNICTGLHS